MMPEGFMAAQRAADAARLAAETARLANEEPVPTEEVTSEEELPAEGVATGAAALPAEAIHDETVPASAHFVDNTSMIVDEILPPSPFQRCSGATPSAERDVHEMVWLCSRCGAVMTDGVYLLPRKSCELHYNYMCSSTWTPLKSNITPFQPFKHPRFTISTFHHFNHFNHSPFQPFGPSISQAY